MGKGNTAVRLWLSDIERFADLFNAKLYKGRRVILPEDLEPIDSETDILLTDKEEQTKGVQRYRDVVMVWKKGVALAVLGCENQAKVHHAMPVRTMVYDGLNYVGQIRQLKKMNEKNHSDKMTDDEFLSGMRRGDKIYPVITLVFYYGKEPWDTNVTLYDMFPKELIQDEKELLQKYVPNYWINLIDAGNVEDPKLFQTDLQEMLGMLKYRNNKADLINYMREHADYFKNVDEDTYHVIGEFLHSEAIMKKEVSRRAGKGNIDMCKALEDLYNDGVNEGIELGINQGEENHLLKQIRAKVAKGLQVEAIAEALEESVDTIQKLMQKV